MLRLKKDLSTAQVYGSGLASLLIILIVYFFTRNTTLLYVCFGVIILLMVWPRPFRYFGMLWLSFGELLGFVVGRLLLTIIYGLLVIPIGLFVRKKIRRNMQLFSFYASKQSAFKQRDHVFSEKDFEKPF